MKEIPAYAESISQAELEASQKADRFLARRVRDWGLFFRDTGAEGTRVKVLFLKFGRVVRGINLQPRQGYPRVSMS